ncbi:MAG: hypothetical protein EAX96_04085 [Candidatus Lokiarchaeota archaeon]|nr:hypothetical protein [Candidatus Lokiarchaeota archaeon]
MLLIFWETKPEIIEKILPPPLESISLPIAISFIANYPEASQGQPYLESALMIRCKFEGITGNYYLAMHVNDDRALVGGREVFGFPKKMAHLGMKKEGNIIKATSERLGTKNLDVKVELSNKFNDIGELLPKLNDPDFRKLQNDPEFLKTVIDIKFLPTKKRGSISYNFKYFPSPSRDGFDYNPRLVRQETKGKIKSFNVGKVLEMTLGSSSHDPWGEVQVVKLLGALYTKSDNSMLPGKVVAEINSEEFLPYSYINWDWY